MDMELKDFVAETLNQIIDGVKTAQEHAKKVDAGINPTPRVTSDYSPKNQYYTEDRRLVQLSSPKLFSQVYPI